MASSAGTRPGLCTKLAVGLRAACRVSSRAVLGAALGVVMVMLPARAEPVTVRLDYLPGAYHAWLFLAQQRGYYKEQGLDVDIQNGQGSVPTLQVVGAGNGTIGLASLAMLPVAASHGVPVVGIAGVLQRPPESLISLKSSGINKPADLVGKRFGDTPNTACSRFFDAFAAANQVDLGTIHKISLGSSGLTAVLHGDVDATCGWATTDALKLARQAPINPPLLFADYGVDTLGIGMFTTVETARTKPDLLRRFLLASIHGADDATKDPQAGIDAVLAAHPELDRAVLADEMQALPAFFHTAHSAGHEFGWVAPEDWHETIAILERHFGLPHDAASDRLYTNEFLPPNG